MSKTKMFKDTGIYAIANYISQGIGMVNSILLRNLLGPTSMGVWNLIQVILGYCGHAGVGTTKALARDYPFLIGQNRQEDAANLKNTTLCFSLMMSIIPAVILLTYVLFKGSSLDKSYRMGLIFLSGFLFLQRFYDVIMTLLRSDKKFGVLSVLIILNAILMLIVTLILVSSFNIYGMYTGTFLVMLISIIYIFYKHPYQLKFRLNKKELLSQLKVGMPLVVCSFLIEFLKGLDRILIAKYIDFYNVGIYSIAIMVNTYIMSAPMMFAHVWYPNLQEAYGKRQTNDGIKNFLHKPLKVFSVFLPFVSCSAMICVPVLVITFLPDYVGGLKVMNIYLIGSYFIILAQFCSNFLITIDRYLILIPALLFSIAVNFILNRYLIIKTGQIDHVAIGAVISFAIFAIFCLVRVLMFFSDAKENIKSFSVILFFPCIFFILTYLIMTYVNIGNLFFNALICEVLLLCVSIPFFIYLEKNFKLLKNIITPIFSKNKESENK